MTRGSTRKAKEAAAAAGQMRENDEGGVNALLSMTGNAASENDIISAMLSMSPSSNNKSVLPSMLSAKRRNLDFGSKRSDAPDLSALGEPSSKRRRLDDDDDEEGDNELDIPMGSSSTPIKEGARYLQSLTVLTKRFLELIRKSKRGEVDLKTVAESLNVQKRRLYDITNVLEGIGLVEKKPKGFIKWSAPDTVDPLKVQQVENQHHMINELVQEESLLDSYIEATSKTLNDLTTSKSSDNTMYVSHSDVLALPSSQGQTVFALKAPVGTTMDVVEPETSTEERKYEIHLKSDGRIDVYLLNNPDNVDSEAPTSGRSASSKVKVDKQAAQKKGPLTKLALVDDNLSESFLPLDSQGGISDLFTEIDLKQIVDGL